MPNTTNNYGLTKPLASEFYDVGVQNSNMDIIDAQMKANADAVANLEEGKADLDSTGKVPSDQLPEMNYDPSGTADTKVNTHNNDQSAHPYLLQEVQDAVSVAQQAQTTADAAFNAVADIAFKIDIVPTQNGSLTYTGSPQTPSWNSYNPDKLTMGGITSATEAGDYVATFTPKGNYKWSDGTTTARSVTWTIRRAAIAAPAQSGSLTYNGSSQIPSWSGYDTEKMNIDGVTSGTNAGSYNATFTPKANYQWSDGSTGARTVAWSIAKAAGSLSINKTSMPLNISTTTDTITVTRAGDGAITAVSSATGVATVSVSGNTVTVTAQSAGSATITISVADGTNYTAPANKTCAVSVSLPVSTLNSNSWATIKQTSDANAGANYWAVGDVKAITINGKVGNTTFSNLAINVFILGFNHNSGKEGTGRIHFQIGKIGTTPVGLCDSSYNNNVSGAGYFHMNDSNTNSGGWNNSSKRKTLYGNSKAPTSPLANSLIAALPSDLRAVMKAVTKYTDNTANGSGSVAGNITATSDYLFDLAEFEVFGSRSYANSYEQNYQLQYDYYKAGNSKIAYNHSAVSTAVRWWLRSPNYTNYTTFCYVNTDGTIGNYPAYRSLALRPGFAA